MITILKDLFGPGTWGTGGNMVAWVICGVIGFGWLHAKAKAMHLARMTQADRHHTELQAQAAAQHNALKAQASRHQQELLDQAGAHHEALKAHVTATARPPAMRKERL